MLCYNRGNLGGIFMSRALSKVAVICALIVVIPLLVVGTGFAAYYSIENILNISVVVDNVSPAEDVFAGVSYGDDQAVITAKSGSSNTSMSVSAGHTSEIQVNAIYSTNAYKFVGWFEGTLEEYQVAVQDAESNGTEIEYYSTSSALVVSMEEEGNYVAVYEVVTYTVEWNYQATPEGSTTTDIPEGGKSGYIYGEELPTLSYTGVDYTFKGWCVNGDTSVKYTAATFPTTYETITLTAAWQSVEKVEIVYVLDDETSVSDSDTVYKDVEYTLPTVAKIFPDAIEYGYEYYWVDGNGNEVTSINTDEDQVILYVEKAEVTYTVNLSSGDDATYNGSETITFTINDTTELEKLFTADNWSTKYTFWVFEGIEYNGTVYTTVSNFVDAVVNTNPHSDVTVNVSVDIYKYFTEFYFNGSLTFYASSSTGTPNYYINVYMERDYNDSNLGNTVTDNGIGDYESTWLVISNFLLIDDDDEYYSPIYNSGSYEKWSLTVNALIITVGNKNYTFTINGDTTLTLNDLIQSLVDQMNIDTFDDTFDAISDASIIVGFVPNERVEE